MPDRYLDRLAGAGDWPGTSWAYTLTGVAPAARLEVDGTLQADRYLPDPQVSAETALRSASAHSVKLSESCYQLSRPGSSISLDSTLASQPLTPPLAPLIGYLSAAYCFTSQLAGLAVKTHQVTGPQSLATVAGSYAVSSADLLRDNLDRPADEVFASTLVVPVFDQVKHGETLAAFASRVGLTPVSLLSQWGNAAAAIIPAGTDLVIAASTGAVDRRLTSIDATIAGTVESLFGDDLAAFCALNGTVAGLLKQDSRLQVRQDTVPHRPIPCGSSSKRTSPAASAWPTSPTANAASVLATARAAAARAAGPGDPGGEPVRIQPGRTLNQIATLFGVSADQLGEQDQDQAGMFVPDQPSRWPASVRSRPARRIAGQPAAKFPASQQPSLPQLIDAIADQTGLMLPGAVLVCPVPLASAAGTGQSAEHRPRWPARFLTAGRRAAAGQVQRGPRSDSSSREPHSRSASMTSW